MKFQRKLWKKLRGYSEKKNSLENFNGGFQFLKKIPILISKEIPDKILKKIPKKISKEIINGNFKENFNGNSKKIHKQILKKFWSGFQGKC